MEQIYMITNDRFKKGGEKVTFEELEQRCRQIDGSVQLKEEVVEGVYNTGKDEPELIAVPMEFANQE